MKIDSSDNHTALDGIGMDGTSVEGGDGVDKSTNIGNTSSITCVCHDEQLTTPELNQR